MTIDLDHLEALARAATPGPWEALSPERSRRLPFVTQVPPVTVGAATGPVAAVEYRRVGSALDVDAAFIAAANPAVILELVERLRAAERPRIVSCPVCGCDEVAQTKDVAELQERLRRAEEELEERRQLAMERSERD